MSTIGLRIKELRIENKITQPQLAEMIEVSNGTISFWENGKAVPNIQTCIKLAQVFKCTLDELVGLTEPTNGYEQNNALPTKLTPNAIAFANDFGDMFNDKNYVDMSKLYKAITPEFRALVLGYIIGILQRHNINTTDIIGY